MSKTSNDKARINRNKYLSNTNRNKISSKFRNTKKITKMNEFDFYPLKTS